MSRDTNIQLLIDLARDGVPCDSILKDCHKGLRPALQELAIAVCSTLGRRAH